MIKPESASILTILTSLARFEVPKYQRAYTWAVPHASEFFEDLNNTESGSLFLGTVIFDVHELNRGKIEVVDGQQRITTILIFLIACRELAKKINQIDIASDIQRKISFISHIGEATGFRLTASESIRDVFEYIAELKWDGQFPDKLPGSNKQVKRQSKKIRPVYEEFCDAITEFNKEQLSTLLNKIYSAYVVRIDIEDSMEAFSIFERTNARGVDLEASDLLKNYLFSLGAANLEDIWPKIVDNSDGTLLRMIKYFYVAKEGYVTKSSLYKEIKAYENKKSVGPDKLVNEILDFSKFYKIARTEDITGIKNYFESIECPAIAGDADTYPQIFYALEGLRLFKIAQIYPLIYAAIECYLRIGAQNDRKLAKQLVKFFDVMEKYHFINTAVCEIMGNKVEKLYADFCKKFAQSKDFEGTLKELIGVLKDRIESEEVFVSRFIEISYSQQAIPLILYIFDRINNFGRKPDQRTRIYDSDQKSWRKGHNVEHIFPKKPKDAKLPDDIIDNIGNLLAIYFRTNSKLGNLSPQEKFEKLRGPLQEDIENKIYVQEFIKRYENKVDNWGEQIIVDRAKELAKEAYNRVWKIN